MSDRNHRRMARRLAVALPVAVAFLLPLVLDDFWLQAGLFSMAAAIGAIGLTLLVGTAGQLSLGHAAFVALGAYVYAWVAGDTGGTQSGLGLPPVLALVAAILAAALAGALFSPISGRLRGIYLGLATLGLIFLARHILINAESATGGYNGRPVEPLAVPGFSFSNSDPDYLAVAGVEFEGLHRLWYVFGVVTLVAAKLASNLRDSRSGRALTNIRDSETAAAAMGINVTRAKAVAFTISSGYAGLAGALMALAFGRIAPDLFGLQLSIDFLVMIVIGGLGSVGGAAIGAVFVITLPLILAEYGTDLPFLAAPGSGGLDGATLSRFAYGVAIIAVLLFLRGGLAGGMHRARLRLRRRRGGGGGTSTQPAAAASSSTTAPPSTPSAPSTTTTTTTTTTGGPRAVPSISANSPRP